jgi:hypothetical protein
MTLLLMIAAAALLTAAGYAHFRIPFHSDSAQKILLTRAVLALVGILFGYVMAASVQTDPTGDLLIFLAGFGAVHVPSAVILFVKRRRGEGKS